MGGATVYDKDKSHARYMANREAILKRMKQRSIDKKEYIREYHKKYAKENKEKLHAKRIKYAADNKEILAQKAKEKYLRNKEHILAQQRSAYLADPRKKIMKTSAYRKKNPPSPEQCRKSNLKHFYGMTTEAYDSMLRGQGGRCAICGSLESRSTLSKNFCIDHDHSTGAVRGLLCSRCNSGLGFFDDKISSFEAAIKYLASAKAQINRSEA